MSTQSHYVVLIHGTWGRRKAEEAVWYIADEAADNFCRRLDVLLKGSDLEAAIWRPCETVQWPFLWSGDNTHQARMDGAAQLYSHIKNVVEAERRAMIHFVAHSHGGNVALAAIDRYLENLDFQARTIYSSLRLLKSKLRRQRQGQAIKPFILSDSWTAAVSDWEAGVGQILRANCGERAAEALETHRLLIEEVRSETEVHNAGRLPGNLLSRWLEEAR